MISAERNVTYYIIGQGRWKVQGVPYIAQNFVNFGQQLASNWTGVFTDPQYSIPFQCSPSHTLQAALTWRRTANSDEMALGSSAAEINLAIASRRAVLSGNASMLIATFSSN